MSKYAAYFAIEKKLSRLGVTQERSEWIDQFTDGAKNSLTELTDNEYKDFLHFLNEVYNSHSKSADKAVKQRRKIIALFCQMGYVTQDVKPDMQRINQWCVQYGHLHKPLNDYHAADLTRLVTQANQVYSTFIHDLHQ